MIAPGLARFPQRPRRRTTSSFSSGNGASRRIPNPARLLASSKGEALVGPTGYAPGHFLDRAPQTSQTERRPLRAVAMRTSAVDHKKGIVGPRLHSVVGDFPMGKGKRSRDMACPVQVGAAHIKQYKIRCAARQCIMHVPAIRFQGKAAGEVCFGFLRGCGRNGGNLIGHGDFPCVSTSWIGGGKSQPAEGERGSDRY